MKLPVTYFFPPAQEFPIRIAAPAQEAIRPQLPIWDGDGGRNEEHCATQAKRRWRLKYRREFLELEVV